jgi:hypothetical protein
LKIFLKIFLFLKMEKVNEFLINFLSKGGVSDEWLKLLTSGECLKTFQVALTHKSVSNTNYEEFEIFGDTILNQSILFWIRKTHPEIKNIEWLTKIKHYLISTKVVGNIGFQLNIGKFIKYDANQIALGSDEYKKMCEDVVEALLGATIVCFNEHLDFDHGVGYQICQNIIHDLLTDLNPSLKYEDVWDDITILKEMYDTQRWIFEVQEMKIDKLRSRFSINHWMAINYDDSYSVSPNLRREYAKLYCNYFKVSSVDDKKRFKLTKDFILKVERLKAGLDVNSLAYAPRLSKADFKMFFGFGQLLAEVVGESDKTSSLKAALGRQGWEFMRSKGYPFAPPPRQDANIQKQQKRYFHSA